MLTYLSYIPIQTILLTAICIWIAFLAFYFIRYKSFTLNFKWFILPLLGSIYSLFFLYFYLFPRSFGATHEPYILFQPVPFQTIASSHLLSIIGHVLMMMVMPLLIYAVANSAKKAVIYSLVVATLIEPLQMLIDWFSRFPHFVVDIDDFILQIIGCVLGWGIVMIFSRFSLKTRVQ